MACCVPGCSLLTKNSLKKVRYHSFPTDCILRKKWVDAVSVTNWNFALHEKSKICSNHFPESCFLPGYSNQRPLLKPGSVPSIFDRDKTVFLQRATSALITNTDSFNPSSPIVIDALPETGIPPYIDQTHKTQDVITSTNTYTCYVNSGATNVLKRTRKNPKNIKNAGKTGSIMNECNCSILINELKELSKKCNQYEIRMLKAESENERLRDALSMEKMVTSTKSKQLSQEKNKSSALEKKIQRILGNPYNFQEKL